MQKNDLLTLTCTRLGSELEGVCSHEGMTIFVAGALPGETVEVQILKVHPTYAFAKLLASLFTRTLPVAVMSAALTEASLLPAIFAVTRLTVAL